MELGTAHPPPPEDRGDIEMKLGDLAVLDEVMDVGC